MSRASSYGAEEGVGRFLRSSAVRWIVGAAAFMLILSVLRYKPWRHDGAGRDGRDGHAPRERLTVGYLPVTCHLTCPVTSFATQTSSTTRFDSQLFMDFPTMAESM